MIVRSTLAASALFLASQASVAADVDAGAKSFNKCKSCHVIESADETIVRGGKVGPNLYAVSGRTAGSQDGFNYSKIMVAAGEQGLVWNEEDFVGYVADPTAYLREFTGDSKGRGKMNFKITKPEEAANLWAYLVSVAPEGGGS
ncbi:MAG: c-type cytochrome [Pseudomonadota bacterium]